MESTDRGIEQDPTGETQDDAATPDKNGEGMGLTRTTP